MSDFDRWRSFLSGVSDRADLPVQDGRVLLRDLKAPKVKVSQSLRVRGKSVHLAKGVAEIDGVRWNSVHFQRSSLQHLRIVRSWFDNCSFEDVDCRDWRLWNTRITNSRFLRANFRSSLLGGSATDGANTFENVEFNECDFRDTVHFASTFSNCLFFKTRLTKVDFRGSRFAHCRFVGQLEEVQFSRTAGSASSFPENVMDEVDFREADFRAVEFRGLDLDRVALPADSNHIIVRGIRKKIGLMLDLLRTRPQTKARVLIADLEHVQKWLGANQDQAVFNRSDLVAFSGEEGLKLFEDVLANVGGCD